jgi:hypothetical protein
LAHLWAAAKAEQGTGIAPEMSAGLRAGTGCVQGGPETLTEDFKPGEEDYRGVPIMLTREKKKMRSRIG